MKRFWILMLALVLALSCFTGAVAEEKIELTLHFWFDGADLEDWQAIVDDFEAANPNISVTLESTPWSDYWTKLKAQSASGSVADVFGMVSMYSADYMKNGVALNMTPLSEGDEAFIGFDGYYQAIMSAYQLDGNTYCLPYDMSTMLITVNKDILAECGVEFKPEGYTKDELLAMGPILKEKGYFTIATGKTDWAYYDLMTRSGCEILDEEGKLNLNNEKIIETTQFYADLMEMGYSPYQADTTDYFSSGLCAMCIQNPEGVANSVKNMEAEIDVIRNYPTEVEGGKVIAEGGSFAIYSGTKHPEAAWALVKALTSPETSIRKVAGTFRGVPTVNDAAATEAFLSSENGVEHAQYFLDVLAEGTRPDYPNRTAVESEMANYLQLIYAGDMTAAEGLAEFQEIADEIMAE